MTGALRHNASLVESLGSAIRSGEHGLSTVPDLLKRILREGSWREFTTRRGEHVEHDRFERFVVTPPLQGIGATVDLVRQVIAHDTEAVDLLDQVLQGVQGKRSDLGNNIPEVGRPEGTSKAKALRRLRKDAPELHTKVIAGDLSAHAAMVQAGFRPRTATVPIEDTERLAAALRRHLDADQLARLIALLVNDPGTAS